MRRDSVREFEARGVAVSNGDLLRDLIDREAVSIGTSALLALQVAERLSEAIKLEVGLDRTVSLKLGTSCNPND
jgi:hypothetical protein